MAYVSYTGFLAVFESTGCAYSYAPKFAGILANFLLAVCRSEVKGRGIIKVIRFFSGCWSCCFFFFVHFVSLCLVV